MQDDADWSTVGVKEVRMLECAFRYRSTIFRTSFHLIDLHNLLFPGSKANDDGYS